MKRILILAICGFLMFSQTIAQETKPQKCKSNTKDGRYRISVLSRVARGNKNLCLISTFMSNKVFAQKTSNNVIHGQVRDLFGEPIQGALIDALLNGSNQHYKTLSDKNGYYELSKLPTDNFTITASFPGFQKKTIVTQLTAEGRKEIDFGLKVGKLTDLPPIELGGTVYQEKGDLEADVTVTATNPFDQSLVQKTKTDNLGRYLIKIDDPGQYIVYVHKPCFKVSINVLVVESKLPREKYTANFVLLPLF